MGTSSLVVRFLLCPVFLVAVASAGTAVSLLSVSFLSDVGVMSWTSLVLAFRS
jgi:hypothetical protein